MVYRLVEENNLVVVKSDTLLFFFLGTEHISQIFLKVFQEDWLQGHHWHSILQESTKSFSSFSLAYLLHQLIFFIFWWGKTRVTVAIKISGTMIVLWVSEKVDRWTILGKHTNGKGILRPLCDHKLCLKFNKGRRFLMLKFDFNWSIFCFGNQKAFSAMIG